MQLLLYIWKLLLLLHFLGCNPVLLTFIQRGWVFKFLCTVYKKCVIGTENDKSKK